MSGSRVNTAAVSVRRRFRDRLAGSAGIGYMHEDYIGLMRTDRTVEAFAELAYDLSRYAAVVGRYDYIHVDSDDPDAGGPEHRASMRLRMRR